MFSKPWLGQHDLCLNVEDINKSADFYLELGFKEIQDHRDEGWVALKHGNFCLDLFQGHIDKNLLNFRGGDIAFLHITIVKRGIELKHDYTVEEDNSKGFSIFDPDQNYIYFNTHPDEEGLLKEL